MIWDQNQGTSRGKMTAEEFDDWVLTISMGIRIMTRMEIVPDLLRNIKDQ